MKLLVAFPKDTVRKLNVHKTFRRRLMYVRFTLCVYGVNSITRLRAGETGGARGAMAPHFFSKQKKINSNNRNMLNIHNITLNWPIYLLLFKFYLIFTICLRVQSTCFLQLLLLLNSIILFV